MSRFADAPIHKITINIYKDDYEFYKQRYGSGWQEVVRQHIKEKVLDMRRKDSGRLP